MDRVEAVRHRLRADLPRLAAAHDIPGLSVEVLADREHVVEHTYGVVNTRTDVPVTADSLFMVHAFGSPVGQGLGWMLSSTSGVVEHGGDTIGVAALLRTVPAHGVAVAVLMNSANIRPVVDELVEPLLREIASTDGAPPLHVPAAAGGPTEMARYLGRYQTRTMRYDVILEKGGRLQLTGRPCNEALSMAEVAGISADPLVHTLQCVGDDTFMLMDAGVATGRAIEFLGADDRGRARFLHSGRAAPRAD